jgi:hypothetical protein
MSAINKGIYERMANDSTLTALLSTYRGAPGIFLIRPIPTDAEFPLVIADEDISVNTFPTKTKQGRTLVRSIKVYTDAESGTRTTSDEIIERIRFLFHRQADQINIEGYKVIIADAENGPEFTPTDDRVFGQEIEVRLTIQRL